MPLLRAIAFALLAPLSLAAADVTVGPTADAGADCAAHIIRRSDDRLFRVACNAVIDLSDGLHHGWLERPREITPSLTSFEVPKQRDVRIATAFVRSGEVRLAPNHSFERVRLFDVESRAGIATSFERVAGANTRMPVGRMVAAAIDSRGMILALSRPTLVRADKAAIVAPQVPQRGADVIALLPRESDALGTVALSLESDAGARPPDVLHDTADRVLAIWYGVEHSRARIVADSKTLELEPIDVVVVPRRVVEARGTLRRMPSIRVNVARPDDDVAAMIEGTLALTLQRPHETKEIRRIEVEKTGGEYRFDSVPRGLYSVSLLIPGGEVETKVDIRSGVDAEVALALEPIVISGTVRHGDEPAHAKVSFRLSRERLEATTDDDGRYELVLWQPRMYEVLTTILDGSGTPPLLDFARVQRSTTYDIDVPKTNVRVRVVDASSGAPVESAKVAVLNAWGGSAEGRGNRQLQTLQTDASGTVRLQPLRAGTAKIHVSARGYVSAEPVQLTITEDTTTVVDVRLRREAQGRSHVVLLADGTPAAGAELLIADPAAPRNVLWRGTAAADGVVEIPGGLAGLVVVIRHPSAASAAQFLRDEDMQFRLGVPAPPLSIRIERWRSWPEPAEITLWIDDVELQGTALAFFVRGSASIPASRNWTAQNLPRKPLRVAATLYSGTLPRETRIAMATTIAFPWPADAVIRVAE